MRRSSLWRHARGNRTTPGKPVYLIKLALPQLGTGRKGENTIGNKNKGMRDICGDASGPVLARPILMIMVLDTLTKSIRNCQQRLSKIAGRGAGSLGKCLACRLRH